MAARYLVATGNWNSTSVWSATSGGAPGASVPIAGDTAELTYAAYTVTVTADTALVDAVNCSRSSIVVNSGVTLNTKSFNITEASGTVTVTNNGTIHTQIVSGSGAYFGISSTVTVTNGTNSLYKISINGQSPGYVIDTDLGFSTHTYKNVELLLGTGFNNATTINFDGSPTFDSLSVTTSNTTTHTVVFDNNATISTTAFSATGYSTGARLVFQGNATSGSGTMLSIASGGSCSGQYLNMDGVRANSASTTNMSIGSGSIQDSGMGWAVPTTITKSLSYEVPDLTTNTYYFDGSGGTIDVLDSYSATNRNASYTLGGSGSDLFAQTFTPSHSAKLTSAEFHIRRSTTVTGDIYCKIYAISGTSGSGAIPTGSPLAVSDAISSASLSTVLSMVSFSFSGENQIDLNSSTSYALAIDATGVSANNINLGVDTTSPTASGNMAVYAAGSWDASSYSGNDLIFSVSGDSSIIDPDSAWANDANAFDGDTGTSASGSTGSSTSNELIGIGTTAPTSGQDIVQVRARINSGSWTTLSEPSGGWTWEEANGLSSASFSVNAGPGAYNVQSSIYDTSSSLLGTPGNIGGASAVSIIELEVTSVSPTTTSTTLQKSIAYAVLTTPTTTQKSLAYFIRRDDLIQKNIAYTVTDTNLIQKTLAYLVTATPAAITKSLGYMVRSTPTATTKSLQYAVSSTVSAIQKGLTYGVDIVASPSNIFSPAVGGFMVGQFWTASSSSTLTQAITKGLEYAIGAGATISKSLAYMVLTPSTITKGITYVILSNSLVQKTLSYTVRTFDSLTKPLTYIIRSNPTITKGLSYVVLTATTLQKSLSYTVLSAEAITKSLAYAVLNPATITKSLAYAIIKTPTAISKLLTYSVVGESAIIQKTLSYRVVMADTIQKSINYAVQASQSITKSLTYYLTSTTYDITKALEYRVKPVTAITKALAYTVLTTPATLTKSISYQVVTNDTIQKGLTYIVEFTTAIEKNLEYRVITTPTTITKAMAYFIGRPISITKSLAYRIKNRYPKPPTMTVEAVQSRWLQVKNQKPPKTIVE